MLQTLVLLSCLFFCFGLKEKTSSRNNITVPKRQKTKLFSHISNVKFGELAVYEEYSSNLFSFSLSTK